MLTSARRLEVVSCGAGSALCIGQTRDAVRLAGITVARVEIVPSVARYANSVISITVVAICWGAQDTGGRHPTIIRGTCLARACAFLAFVAVQILTGVTLVVLVLVSVLAA